MVLINRLVSGASKVMIAVWVLVIVLKTRPGPSRGMGPKFSEVWACVC